MLKKFSAFLLSAALLCGLFAGCSAEPAANDAGSTPVSTPDTTSSLQTAPVHLAASGNQEEGTDTTELKYVFMFTADGVELPADPVNERLLAP